MEDQATPQDLAASRSAEALSALCERAQSSVEARREGIGRLEARLAEQLDALTEAMAGQLSDLSAESEEEKAHREAQAADAAALQEELTQSQKEFEQRQAEWEAHVQERGDELSQLAEDLDRREAKWETHVRERGQELTRQTDELKQQEEELQQRQQEMEAKTAEWQAQEEQAATAAEERSAQTEALNSRQSELDQREETLHSLQAELEQREQKFSERQADLDKQLGELKRKQTEFEAQTSDAAHREQAEGEHATSLQEWSAELEQREEQFRQANADLQRRLEDLQANGQAAEEKRDQLDAWQQELDARQEEIDVREQALAAGGDAPADSGAAAALTELQRQFDDAIEDTAKLREQVAELEGQLAQRKDDAGGDDSAELADLREERDALAQRVASLESRLESGSDGDASEELTDLQQRFEMALDDVRQLKTENARLEERLAAAASSSGSLADTGAMDWEAQKRRMLAGLEGDDVDLEPDERQERASIEDTIRITDEVVAAKDREIEALREQMAQAPAEAPPADAEAVQRDELLNADEVIQQHRRQLAELEQEMRDKLRQTELDLSVERAKITREQSELAEWRLELEALRESLAGGGSAGSQPKRRWLNKLGLGQDEGS